MRKILLLCLITLLLSSFGVVAAQDNPNILIMARSADTTGLDPHTQTAFASFRLLELSYEPLVILDENLNVVPALAESRGIAEMAPSLMIYPALSIMLGVLGFNLLGDGLRDILDPRMKGQR